MNRKEAEALDTHNIVFWHIIRAAIDTISNAETIVRNIYFYMMEEIENEINATEDIAAASSFHTHTHTTKVIRTRYI